MVRLKERYLLVNIIYPPSLATKIAEVNVPSIVVQRQPTTEALSAQALLQAIRSEVKVLFGDYGSGCFENHLSVKYLSLATSTIILRCSRSHYQMLWAALTFMDRVPVKHGRPCIFHVARVSGTIRKAEEEAIRQAKQLILTAKDQHAGSLRFMEPSPPREQPGSTLTATSPDGSSDEEMDEVDDDD